MLFFAGFLLFLRCFVFVVLLFLLFCCCGCWLCLSFCKNDFSKFVHLTHVTCRMFLKTALSVFMINLPLSIKQAVACLFCHVWTSLYSPTPLQSTLGSHRQQTSAWTSVAWLGLWSLHSCSSLGLLLGPPPSHSLLMLPPLCPSPQAQAQCPPSSFARFVLVLKVAWRVLALIWVAWAWTQLTSW